MFSNFIAISSQGSEKTFKLGMIHSWSNVFSTMTLYLLCMTQYDLTLIQPEVPRASRGGSQVTYRQGQICPCLVGLGLNMGEKCASLTGMKQIPLIKGIDHYFLPLFKIEKLSVLRAETLIDGTHSHLPFLPSF